ncbi:MULTISPECIES: hypothetical protein [Gammaproteobacteria]|jgi:uncharacterized lipoprotein YehR (DUF1307 family)|uniref:hypothetical protein n=1 Tax=Gammaproteobacteria TaxID=1236 RepID=UPI001237A81B|nr:MULTISPECIES: hypothetical protein [Gammaproteobacteria]MCH2058566.1 hypothetical protein [Thalassotalea sp.]MCG7641094.1 hypothetical protein [Alteromonas sp. MmMcT2-2]CAI2389235.1 hypothetical protein ALT831_01160 [Alteromonas macleodii]CAI3941228.1 hypothetical protein ALTBGP9_01090 [Alteromonas macleodii]CAI3942231.1 hypothetical protein ALTBGP14_01160 [Alteromonas macleodii]|tara:strand:+ start:1300 stop:1572 length:273 start_codon:yes stop_codon:yes gene_type:complete
MKKVTKIILASSLALALGACGSTDNQSSEYAKANTNGGDDGMVCKMEKKIGSNRMQRVCYSVEERENMREAGREGWLRMQRGSETGGGDL